MSTITTPPAIGSAEIAPNAIVYTPPADVLANTPVTIGYTYTVVATTSAPATLSFTVNDVSVPPPQPSTLAEDEPLPAPVGAVLAATPANFMTHYNAAANGQHITLASGSYGNVTLSRAFSPTNPVVIRALTSFGPVFTRISAASGSGVIISGVTINQGTGVTSGTACELGSRSRLTRSCLQNGRFGITFGTGAIDLMIDHCELITFTDTVYLGSPRTQLRPVVARCWIHGGSGSQFAWTNSMRDIQINSIARFNYVGPGTGDAIHHKGGLALYAFNRIEAGMLSSRFGTRKRFVGNYSSNQMLRLWDDRAWAFGNRVTKIECPGGSSSMYDDTKSHALITGGFYAHKRSRLSGNISPIYLGTNYTGSNWCTRSSDYLGTQYPGVIPDPQPAGGRKPANSYAGVNYAADPAGDPDEGITVRAHSGTITRQPNSSGGACGASFDWVVNDDVQVGVAAPGSWLTELFAAYPWMEAICPNPLSQTGAGGAHPSSIAQALQPGDVSTATTNTCGPRRTTGGGLMPS